MKVLVVGATGKYASPREFPDKDGLERQGDELMGQPPDRGSLVGSEVFGLDGCPIFLSPHLLPSFGGSVGSIDSRVVQGMGGKAGEIEPAVQPKDSATYETSSKYGWLYFSIATFLSVFV